MRRMRRIRRVEPTHERLWPDAAQVAAERPLSVAPDDVVPEREGGRTSIVTSGGERGRDQRKEGGWEHPESAAGDADRHPCMRKGPG